MEGTPDARQRLASVKFNARNNFGTKAGDPDLYWYACAQPAVHLSHPGELSFEPADTK